MDFVDDHHTPVLLTTPVVRQVVEGDHQGVWRGGRKWTISEHGVINPAGKQLDDHDRAKIAIRLYNGGEGIEKKEIAEVLSVASRTVDRYLHDIEEQLRQERYERIFNLWLARTLQEIADEVGVSKETVSQELQIRQKTEALPKSDTSAMEHSDGFEPQIYSVWNFPKWTTVIADCELQAPGD